MKVCRCGNKYFIGEMCGECKKDLKEENKKRVERVGKWFEEHKKNTEKEK